MKLYRLMKKARDGLPVVGIKFGMLGVRPKNSLKPKNRFDVPAILPFDLVRLGDGGLSVNVDPDELKPPDEEFVLWVIDSEHLEFGLEAIPANPPHYIIGVTVEMTLVDFQQCLTATRNHWQLVQLEEEQ